MYSIAMHENLYSVLVPSPRHRIDFYTVQAVQISSLVITKKNKVIQLRPLGWISFANRQQQSLSKTSEKTISMCSWSHQGGKDNQK